MQMRPEGGYSGLWRSRGTKEPVAVRPPPSITAKRFFYMAFFDFFPYFIYNSGEINSIIVAKTGKLFSGMVGKNNVTIPWEKIEKIGEDVILVNL